MKNISSWFLHSDQNKTFFVPMWFFLNILYVSVATCTAQRTTAVFLSPISFKHPHWEAQCRPEDSSRSYWCETILQSVCLSVFFSLLASVPIFLFLFRCLSPSSSSPLSSSPCCSYYFLSLFSPPHLSFRRLL